MNTKYGKLSFVVLHCKYYGFKDLDEFHSCDLNSQLLVAVTILQSYGLDRVEQVKRSKTHLADGKILSSFSTFSYAGKG